MNNISQFDIFKSFNYIYDPITKTYRNKLIALDHKNIKNNNEDKIEHTINLPVIIDILFIYNETQDIYTNIILNSRNKNSLSQLIGKRMPLAIILNCNDNAYLTQNFSKSTISWLLDNTHV